MKKLTKLGLSALCGSLATVSAAVAGEIAVTGGATATWTSHTKGAITGNPLGMASNMTFTGSGELDGGQTFSIVVTNQDKSAYSAANLSLTTNSLGSFKLGSGTSAGIGAYDDVAPTAWEEVWGNGIGTSIQMASGVTGSTNIQWTSPAGPSGTKLILAYSPSNDGAYNNDKTASGVTSSLLGEGWDVVLDIAPDSPVNLFLGYHETWQGKDKGVAVENISDDIQEGVAGIKLSLGPVQVGTQVSVEALHPVGRDVVGTYANQFWGASFNVNDNLSFSYGEFRSLKGYTSQHVRHPGSAQNTGGNTWNRKKWMSGDSIQAAFTMGGASVKIAETDIENAAYSEGADKSARTIALTLAF